MDRVSHCLHKVDPEFIKKENELLDLGMNTEGQNGQFAEAVEKAAAKVHSSFSSLVMSVAAVCSRSSDHGSIFRR